MTFSGFFEFLGNLEWLAVLLGSVGTMLLGYLWYGPLFGRLWASKSGAGMQSGEPAKMVQTAIYFVVFNIALQYLSLVIGKFDIEKALVAGIILGILAIGPALYSRSVWAKTHMTVFFIDVAFWFAATVVAIIVQGFVF
jgi:hypothetical protein